MMFSSNNIRGQAPLDQTQKNLTALVNVMQRKLWTDFSGGIVGARYNIFQHRSRIVRKMEVELQEMTKRPHHA